MSDLIDIDALKNILRDFVAERDWNQFQNPKNLAMALVAEGGELLEIFQWLSEQEAAEVGKKDHLKLRTGEELADIMIYLIRLADHLQINLKEAIQAKMIQNSKKYPVERVKGSAKKYNEYTENDE